MLAEHNRFKIINRERWVRLVIWGCGDKGLEAVNVSLGNFIQILTLESLVGCGGGGMDARSDQQSGRGWTVRQRIDFGAPSDAQGGSAGQKNGTSLPSSAANSASVSNGTLFPRSTGSARRIEAALLDPPPSPPPRGMRLVRLMRS